MANPASEAVIPSPSDMPAQPYIHRVSGLVLESRPVGFRVAGDTLTPLFWPPLDKDWEPVINLGNGYFSCHGREALSVQALASKIKDGRP